MRPPIFVFLALVISQAVAFGLYGAYERVMYWNAYQLDAESPERKVAKACAKNPGVQGAKLGNLVNGRCNFRQFLYYISATDKEKANIKRLDANLGNEKNINIIANELYDKGVVGQYTTETLYEGVKRNDVPALFKAMG
ncbi:hypothetical protein N7491_006349 [Penicillium cf. griseofulvum]|nr:hypothetical protein N7491_006349 [Penicillium cf. griseofulvum]KAJ5436889.1 hypothetical protein N7445_007774 [Penicillium cf. griseofulvum]